MQIREHVNIWTLSDLCTPWCVHVVVTLRIADQVRVECLRSSVVGLQAAGGEEKDKRDTGS